ncbi:MAG: hypothetical protein ACLFTT_16120 [Candidatus Hydrogenedentota bacterium]
MRMLSWLLLAACLWVPQTADAVPREAAFTLWDWTTPCRDIDTFEAWVANLAELGFTHVEISAPWKTLEPEPGHYALAFVRDRLALCERHGLGMRVRINSFLRGATPEWYGGAVWQDADGKEVQGGIPSIMDDTFWARFGPLCTVLARAFAASDVYWSPFIGVHAELKWADWWSYDAATLAAWRECIAAPRPPWLTAIVSRGTELPQRPPEPPPTQGTPDTNPVHNAVIAFREHCWRQAVARFVTAIEEGNPAARVSVPLGESYRRLSAHMANLDYHGYSRGADQVVHSYDFFWHAQDAPWHAAASVAAFQGITGLPVVFELDGPVLLSDHGYTVQKLVALGKAAHAQGAGLNVSNWSYHAPQPSSHETVRAFANLWRAAAKKRGAPQHDTVLLFLSKWANYQYREDTNWLHAAQFGVWKLLRDLDVPTRIICEDNLGENLEAYRALWLAFSPPALLPNAAQERLESLNLPTVIDMPVVPEMRDTGERAYDERLGMKVCVAGAACPVAPAPADARAGAAAWVFGYPIGHVYVHGPDPAMQRTLARKVLEKVSEQARSTP